MSTDEKTARSENWIVSTDPDFLYEHKTKGFKIFGTWGTKKTEDNDNEPEYFYILYDQNNIPISDEYIIDNEEEVIPFFTEEIKEF